MAEHVIFDWNLQWGPLDDPECKKFVHDNQWKPWVLNQDIREIKAVATLPAKLSKITNVILYGKHVVQISKVADFCHPSQTCAGLGYFHQYSQKAIHCVDCTGQKFILCDFNDPKSGEGLKWDKAVPGEKLLLGPYVVVENGIIFISKQNCQQLKGKVPKLLDLHQNYLRNNSQHTKILWLQNLSVNEKKHLNRLEGQAPPFVSFEDKHLMKNANGSTGQDNNKKQDSGKKQDGNHDGKKQEQKNQDSKKDNDWEDGNWEDGNDWSGDWGDGNDWGDWDGTDWNQNPAANGKSNQQSANSAPKPTSNGNSSKNRNQFNQKYQQNEQSDWSAGGGNQGGKDWGGGNDWNTAERNNNQSQGRNNKGGGGNNKSQGAGNKGGNKNQYYNNWY